eukprot:PhM_4_TR14116/c1_g3_i9/m.42871
MDKLQRTLAYVGRQLEGLTAWSRSIEAALAGAYGWGTFGAFGHAPVGSGMGPQYVGYSSPFVGQVGKTWRHDPYRGCALSEPAAEPAANTAHVRQGVEGDVSFLVSMTPLDLYISTLQTMGALVPMHQANMGPAPALARGCTRGCPDVHDSATAKEGRPSGHQQLAQDNASCRTSQNYLTRSSCSECVTRLTTSLCPRRLASARDEARHSTHALSGRLWTSRRARECRYTDVLLTSPKPSTLFSGTRSQQQLSYWKAPQQLINAVFHVMIGHTLRVRVGDQLTEDIPVSLGVLQGDTLASCTSSSSSYVR